MSEETTTANTFLDAFAGVKDVGTEMEAQFQAHHPELEEEEKEATERDCLQRQDEEQVEFYRGRIPRGANEDGRILFHL